MLIQKNEQIKTRGLKKEKQLEQHDMNLLGTDRRRMKLDGQCNVKRINKNVKANTGNEFI